MNIPNKNSLLCVLLFTLTLVCHQALPLNATVVPDSMWQVVKKGVDTESKIAALQYLIRNHLEEESDLKQLLSFIDKTDLNAEENIDLKFRALRQVAGKGYDSYVIEELELLLEKAKTNPLRNSEARVLLEISHILINRGSTAESKVKLDQALSLNVEDINTQSLINKAYSFYHYKTGEYDEGLSAIDKAINACIILPPSVIVVESYLQKGRILRAKGEIELAKESYISSEEYALQNDFEDALGPVLNNLGNIEHISGNYAEALEYYVRSLEIKERNNNVRGVSMSHFNIAAIQMDMGNEGEALTGLIKALEIATDIEHHGLEIACNQRIGSIYRDQEKFSKAVAHHKAGLALSTSSKNKKGRVAGHYNLGEDYLASLEYKMAYKHYLDAYALAKEIGHKQYISAILTGIAKIYISQESVDSGVALELLANNKVDFNENEIEKLLLQAREMAETINDTENKSEAYEALSLFYNLTGNTRAEANALKQFMSIKDSIFNKESADAVANWQTKYKTAQKELEISELKSSQEISKLRNQRVQAGMLGGFFVLLLGGLLGFLQWRNKQEKKAMKEKENFRSNLSSELHDDVGSILTGLAMQSELMEMYVSDEHIPQVQGMAKMSREAMERMRDTVWAIDSRKDSYQDLKDRMLDFSSDILTPVGKQLNIDLAALEKSSALRPDLRQAIYLIFKEAATNVAKYSNSKKVDCNIVQNEKQVILHIRDYGEVDADSIKTSGTGLSNMKLRTEKLNGVFRHYIDGGFHIECTFPIQ